jgi:type IV secretory pathway VirB10-like protein
MSKADKKRKPTETEEVVISSSHEDVEHIVADIPMGTIEESLPTVEKHLDQQQQQRSPEIPPELVERIQKLEQANLKQSEELRKLQREEQIKVDDAPLEIDMTKFKEGYERYTQSSNTKKATQLEIASGEAPAPLTGNSLLPPMDELQWDGIEELSREDLKNSAAAQNAYNKRASDDQFILPYKVQEAVSELEVKAGSIIPIPLVTGINSDLEGNIIAQVNSNVWDSRTGDYLLIPQGTKVLGSYESDNVIGVERVGIVWNRLIFPNGDSLSIEDMRGSDVEGYSGLKDKVNNHYGRIFGSALMLSAVTTSVALVEDDSNTFDNRSVSQTAREEVALNLGRVMTEKLRQDMNIEPTIEIRPGKKNLIIVAKDMTFEKPYEQHINYDELRHPQAQPRTSFDPTQGTRKTAKGYNLSIQGYDK